MIPLLLFFTLVTAASSVDAASFLTYDQIVFYVAEEPGPLRNLIYLGENRMEIKQSLKTVYELRSSTGRRLPLSERSFEILTLLFKTRNEFRRPHELDKMLAEESNFKVENWDEEISRLNFHIKNTFGKPLVLSKNEGPGMNSFKMAANRAGDGIDNSLWALHESNARMDYRGKSVKMSPRQIEIITALTSQPDGRISVDELSEHLNVRAQGIRNHVKDINRKSFHSTGATLIEKQDGNLLRFSPKPLPVLPNDRKELKVRGKALELNSVQQLIFDSFKLSSRPLSAEISLNIEDVEATGATFPQILSNLRIINNKYIDLFGKPAVQIIDIDDSHANGTLGTTKYWFEGDFRWTRNIDTAREECEKLLVNE